MDLVKRRHARLTQVATAARRLVEAEDELWAAVAEARRSDGELPAESWAQIGAVLGVSKQACFERFSKPPRGRLV